MTAPDTRQNLLDLSFHKMEDFLTDLGEPPFRARQVWQWLWQKKTVSPAEMTNVTKVLREKLEEVACIRRPEVAKRLESRDGTVKYVLALADGNAVETVLIPEKGYFTQCLSSQVGCAMACTFCRTGQMGLTRNLTPGEILGQILVARADIEARGFPFKLRNLVFMGMGEPLLNYNNLLQSLESLHHPQGLDFAARRITVSTVGIVPGLLEAGKSGLCALAISLHAPTQELRAQIMPKAARLPLDELLRVLEQVPLKPRERLTFEYVLLGGVNDSPAEARELVRLMRRVRGKVNLIAFNPAPGLPYDAPDPVKVKAFQKIIWDEEITVTLRKSKGQDIFAACGQLLAQEGG